jgi:multidrug efflux system outer membrane protein
MIPTRNNSCSAAKVASPRVFVGAIFGAAALVVAGGCSVGPDYHRPEPTAVGPIPKAFSATEATNGPVWTPSQPASDLPRGEWWTLFGDRELNRLENLASTGNQDLVAAMARLDQAREQVKVARADFFPQLTGNAAALRQRTSVNAPQSGQAAGASYTYNSFIVPLNLSWELDFWGRIRRQTEAARAQLQASADDLESMRLALQAEVASDYFMLRALDSEYRIVADTIETFRRSLDLTINRRKGGVASDLDVSQAETQLRSTEAQLPAIELQSSSVRHALAALCGAPATGFEVVLTGTNRAAVPAMPVALPSELLERRPDIAAAERRVAAANANIGVAKSAFYPRVMLQGLAGFQSVSASTLFDWPSRAWAVGPTIEWPLFTGGRNKAQLEISRLFYTETVANYRQTVLTAFQEVEDGLAAGHLLAAQLDAESAALSSAKRTLTIANNRYTAGLVTYLEVAVAQGSELSSQRTVVQLQGQCRVAQVALIKAVGGGWNPQSEGTASMAGAPSSVP